MVKILKKFLRKEVLVMKKSTNNTKQKVLNKRLFKYRIKLMLCNIKIGVLFILCYLWLFFPGLITLLLPKSGSLVLGWLCIIFIYFNFNLLPGTNKWFDKLKSEKNKLWCHINELHYLIEEEKERKEFL